MIAAPLPTVNDPSIIVLSENVEIPELTINPPEFILTPLLAVTTPTESIFVTSS